MKRNKLLIRINELGEINEYKKLGISNFLFPLEEFSIGYQTFSLDELKKLNDNVYLLVNRVLDNRSIDDFKEIIPKLDFVRGIIFEDIGIYNLLKDTSIPLIWNQNHFAVNHQSINIWLSKVSSAVVSNELEISELKNVLEKINKPIILPILGLNMAMYSRRSLLSFFNEYNHLKDLKRAILRTNNNKEFLAIENEYGTVLFYNKYYNLFDVLDSLNDDKILFYYIDPNNLKHQDIENFLKGKKIEFDNGFLENKTIYRIGDLND